MDGDHDAPTVTLRPYTPEDADALWGLKRAFERTLADDDDEKAERYEGKLTEPYRDGYLAWAADCVAREPACLQLAAVDAGEGDDGTDDDPIGYVFVLPADLAYVWDAAVVNELYVAPAARGTGVADRLMDAAVAHARRQPLPLDRLVLDVDPDNARAYGFYERYGFEPWAEMVAYEL